MTITSSQIFDYVIKAIITANNDNRTNNDDTDENKINDDAGYDIDSDDDGRDDVVVMAQTLTNYRCHQLALV